MATQLGLKYQDTGPESQPFIAAAPHLCTIPPSFHFCQAQRAPLLVFMYVPVQYFTTEALELIEILSEREWIFLDSAPFLP